MGRDEQMPEVGVGVLILKDGKILLGKRMGKRGAGEFEFPGGKLDYMESFEDCARRETMEESGIEIENVKFQCLVNSNAYAPGHWVHIGMIADWKSGEPEVLEPDKLESWDWYDLDDLPEPLFKFCEMAVEVYRGGKIYYDLE